MHKSLFYLPLVVAITGCATVSPTPSDDTSILAASNFEPARDGNLSIPSRWYPNQIFPREIGTDLPPYGTNGRLFITKDSLIFAIYDGASDSYIQAFKAPVNDITGLTIRQFGSIIGLSIQAYSAINSFQIVDGVDRTWKPVSSKDIVELLVSRFNAKLVP